MSQNCEFSNPLNLSGVSPTSTEIWNYQKLNCTSTEIEIVENASTGASFYIAKQISYGDILLVTFLTLFLIFGIFKFLVGFIIPKRINFKR